MTPSEVEQFRALLEPLERVLMAAVAADGSADSSIVIDNAIGRLTRMEAIQAQAMGQAGKRRQEQRLLHVRAALKRIEQGTYGQCVRCGDAIPAGRLEVRPESGLCMACAQRG